MTSSTVTLPLSVFLLHRHGLGSVLLIGLIPALPYLLVALGFAVMYLLLSILAILRFALSRTDNPMGEIEKLYTMITNAPIAFLTLTPVDVSQGSDDQPARTPAGARRRSTGTARPSRA